MDKKLGRGSVSGDTGAKSAAAFSGFFKRKIKNSGRTAACAKPLTYRPFAKAGGDNS